MADTSGERLRERREDAIRREPTSHHDGQAFPGVLVQDRQHAKRLPVMRAVRKAYAHT